MSKACASNPRLVYGLEARRLNSCSVLANSQAVLMSVAQCQPHPACNSVTHLPVVSDLVVRQHAILPASCIKHDAGFGKFRCSSHLWDALLFVAPYNMATAKTCQHIPSNPAAPVYYKFLTSMNATPCLLLIKSSPSTCAASCGAKLMHGQAWP